MKNTFKEEKNEKKRMELILPLYEKNRQSRVATLNNTKVWAREKYKVAADKVKSIDKDKAGQVAGALFTVIELLYPQPIGKVAMKINPKLATKAPSLLKKGAHYARRGAKYLEATSKLIAISQL